MDILKVGDKERVVCENCSKFVIATYKLRSVPFNDRSGVVKNVLVGVCDECDEFCVLPHQSTPLVKKVLEKESRPVEVRIPNHFRDILNVISCDFIGSNTSFAPHILKYYIYGLSKNKISSRKLPSYLNSDLAKGVADKRISLKGRDIISHIDILKTTTKIDKTTDIIKSVILKTKYDILDNNRQKPIKALKGIAAAIS